MNRVLILEPAKSVRKGICELIEINGFDVIGVEDMAHCESACELAKERNLPFDLLIYNVDCHPEECRLLTMPSIALSNHPSVDEALLASRFGARDYISRPYDLNRLLRVVREALESRDEGCNECVVSENTTAKEDQSTSPSPLSAKGVARMRRRSSKRVCEPHPMIGNSAGITKLRSMIAKIAPFDARVVILGENGTGKELVARSIHDMSHRCSAPFVEVNCAAIPADLIESELFGHEKGAFTSAVKQRRGKFEQANGGTLFLDEIGDMSLAAQAKVLRALQEHKITRVGSDCNIEVDVRVLAATNKDIRAEIAAGNFREDLYHRLSVITLNVVALRDRAEDIPLLVEHFMQQICGEYNLAPKEVTAGAMERLMGRSWSGNIRELRNVVERLIVLSDERIEAADVDMYCMPE